MSAWQLRAACREYDPRLWDGDDEASTEAARAICQGCEVRNDCGVAGKDEPECVWAGLDPMERLGSMLLATPEPPPHVASRGCYVTRHCQRPECRAENARYVAAYRQRQVAVTATASIEFEQLTWEVSA